MFDSEDEAYEFRSELVHALDDTDTDGWHISPRFDGARLWLADNTAIVRGHLDGQGYRIEDRTDGETEADGWEAELVVKGGGGS